MTKDKQRIVDFLRRNSLRNTKTNYENTPDGIGWSLNLKTEKVEKLCQELVKENKLLVDPGKHGNEYFTE